MIPVLFPLPEFGDTVGVYCRYCAFFVGNECRHKENLGNWESPMSSRRKPEIINRKNDCKRFEHRR